MSLHCVVALTEEEYQKTRAYLEREFAKSGRLGEFELPPNAIINQLSLDQLPQKPSELKLLPAAKMKM